MGNRKPGRPLKHVGLATPANLKKVVDGNELRDMRREESEPEGQVLPQAPADSSPQNGGRGVFGAIDDNHGGRGATPLKPSVLNSPGRDEEDGELRLSVLFKRLLNEVAAPEYQEGGTPLLNAEVLARGILDDALKGDKAARELVIDRVEGKAVRGEKVQTSDTTTEDQVDEASVALLNGLSGAPDKGAQNV